MSFRFHHVHLICSDLERTLDFFCTTLGARLVARRKFGTADGATLDLDGVTVNLRVPRDEERPLEDASRTRCGYDHIGLKVDDVDTVYADLHGKGFTFTVPPRDAGDLRIAFFRGPDHIVVELVQSRNLS